jgi:hypothetical protein
MSSARDICLILSMTGIIAGIPCIVAVCYYLIRLRTEIRPERRALTHLVAPIAVFLPQFWTEQGNRYRKLFLLSVLVFGLFAMLPLICDKLVH